jgi:signal transduction histidine kinase
LTAVIGYLELLEEGALGAITEEQTEVLGIMRRNGDRLLDLIGDLLLVGSFESGRPVSSRPVDLANLVDVVTRELSGAGAKAGLALEVRSEGAAWVSGDDGELKTVIANLVGNACKFTPAGGRVGVIVSSRAGFVTLEVSDTGIGIPTEDLDRIFDRFYRGDHARKSEIQGAGLGLAIVDAVVKRHGGSVDITSEPGEGTTFTVTLPASAKGGDADEHGPGGR